MVKFHVLKDKPDIVAVTKTWLNPMLPDAMFSIPGYNLLRNDSRAIPKDNGDGVKKGGGVALYLKCDINFSSSELSHFNVTCQ